MELLFEDKVIRASVAQVYKNSKMGTFGLFAMLLFVVFLLKDKIPVSVLIVGFSFHASVLLWRTYKIYKYHKLKDNFDGVEVDKYWLSVYRNNTFLIGVGWGL